MTPETEGSTLYFWSAVREHAVGNPRVDELLFGQVSEAFAEDKAVLEAQQQVIARYGDSWANALRADEGSVASRRVVQRLMDAEAAAAGASAPKTLSG